MGSPIPSHFHHGPGTCQRPDFGQRKRHVHGGPETLVVQEFSGSSGDSAQGKGVKCYIRNPLQGLLFFP